ncbi:MAG: DUF3800 domain-containing protein [Chloroflexi bacterium]|nr:DUF3800 domain-containing protein [Chloroflexota bacterium]
MSTTPRRLYLFLDEAGNLDFSPSGTRYFMLGSVTKERPFRAYQELTSKSNFDLQIADYCTWAVYRKWSLADPRCFELIAPAVRSEWDFFQTEMTTYY